MLQIIVSILAFSLLVIVHELGHFVTAKTSGVQVNEFWVGMGPTLLKKEYRGTLYCLNLLPFGGACVMEGEDGESESGNAFSKASLPRRILIVAAGALMNFLLGFLLVLAVTTPNSTGGFIVPTLDTVDARSTAAAEGGLQAGDTLLKIDGYHILTRSDVSTALARGGDTVYEIVVRRNGKRLTLPAVRMDATVPDESGRLLIGITFAEQADSLPLRVDQAARTSLNLARLVWSSLGELVSGRVGVEQLSGPVGVTEAMADTVKSSMTAFIRLVAFISINLGVMNLLPLPALDGGRLVFLLIEAVRRKPVPPKYEGYVHAAGLVVLLTLMLFITGNDIWRIITR